MEILLIREIYKLPGSNTLILRPRLVGLDQWLNFRWDEERKYLAIRILEDAKLSFDRIPQILSSIKNVPYVKALRVKISAEYDYPVFAYGEFELERFFNKLDYNGLFSGKTLIFDHYICQPLFVNHQVVGYLMVDFEGNVRSEWLIQIIRSYSDVISRQLSLDLKLKEVQQQQKIISRKQWQYKRWRKRDKLLLSMLMHDLKSPLLAIKGYLHLLENIEDGTDTEHVYNRIDYGLHDVMRMVNQINELLTQKRSDNSLTLVSIEINWLIAETVDFMMSFAKEKKRFLQFKRSDEPIYLETDIDKVKRIIENLINNAIKHTDKDGNIIVGVKKEKNEVLITVRDDGHGIPNNIVDHIFEPYNKYETEHTEPDDFFSVGLGLYNCSLFSRMLGARLTVESKKGEGSVFCLHHPIKKSLK